MAFPALENARIMTLPQFVPAVEILRGGTVESVHCAAGVVVDADGAVIASIGDPHVLTFSRSSLKPLQALASVMRGYPERFDLTERHLALACASHSGEERHARAAAEMLAAIGATADDLQCGTHIPIFYRAEDGAIPAKSTFTAIHNNCSGKHACMLALARILDVPLKDYLELDGQVQTVIRETISEVTGSEPESFETGTDGCSAPNYAMPLSALAQGFARLAWASTQDVEMLSDIDSAGGKIARAMMAYPEMVSGTGRFDLQLVEAAGKTIFSKVGAEALECAGIPEHGWGIVIKIADGNARAIPPLMISILEQLGVLDSKALATLDAVRRPEVKNVRGLTVGSLQCIAELHIM